MFLGNVHHRTLPATRLDGAGVREHLLGQDARNTYDDSHQQTIHFTVRLFLAKKRQEVTQSDCPLTAGSAVPTLRYDADQPPMAWLLEKSKKKKELEREETKNKNEKKGKATWTKKAKNDDPDTLIIMEDEPSEGNVAAPNTSQDILLSSY